MIRGALLQERGLGRITKVGKEGIVGAMAALEAWERRDHAGERAREEAIVRHWLTALYNLPGVAATPHPDWTGNPITRVELRLEPNQAGLFAWELASRLMAGTPAIAVRDILADHQLLYLDPCNLVMAEAEIVADTLRAVCDAARTSGDGCAISWSEAKRAHAQIDLPWLD